jgi:hypothetical protein
VARASAFAIAALVLAGCYASQDSGFAEVGGSLMDDLPPSTNCPGTTETGACAESTGAIDESGSGGTCQVSGDCPNGQACLAPFDGEIGEFACVPGCIGIMDEASWCADATACCDAEAICTMRGYCVLPDGGSSTSDGASTGGASSSGSDGGASSGESGDATGGSSGTQ